MQNSKPIKMYRWFVFLAAAFYVIYMTVSSDYSKPGGPFRYLTIWGLFLACFCSARVLLLSYGKARDGWDAFVSASCIVNAMVVFLYWKLFFEDPSSVTRNGELGDLWLEFYLHLTGPIFLWIDALFINRVFRKIGKAALWLAGLIAAYLTWAELFVGRFNDIPVGTVTSGLPYPFLNNLELGGRMTFYVTNILVALVLLVVFAGIAFVIRRLLPRVAA